MSCVEVRERSRDSPERARSLLTVRAAISSARSSDVPRSFALSLMCSYCRARLVPFLTPRGGIPLVFPSVRVAMCLVSVAVAVMTLALRGGGGDRGDGAAQR